MEKFIRRRHVDLHRDIFSKILTSSIFKKSIFSLLSFHGFFARDKSPIVIRTRDLPR